MTQAPETGTINRLHFLAPVSGTCVMHRDIWHRIRLVPVPLSPNSHPRTAVPSWAMWCYTELLLQTNASCKLPG